MNRPERSSEELEQSLDHVGGVLRRAAGEARFAPGFDARVMRRLAVQRDRVPVVEKMIALYFRRFVAPVALAAAAVALVFNLAGTRYEGASPFDRVLGIVQEEAQPQPVDLYAMYTR